MKAQWQYFRGAAESGVGEDERRQGAKHQRCLVRAPTRVGWRTGSAPVSTRPHAEKRRRSLNRVGSGDKPPAKLSERGGCTQTLPAGETRPRRCAVMHVCT